VIGSDAGPRSAAVGEPALTPAAAARRLVCLHLVSRRAPGAVLAMAACAGMLRGALAAHWITTTGPSARQLPALLEAAVATVIAITAHSPFGESERTGGRWLPWLRLGTAVLLADAAIGLLLAGAAGAGLPDGTLAVVRNVTGVAGIGLSCAVVTGGLLAWVGPVAYAVLAEFAISQLWTSPWMWPARAAHDRGAALCAALVFAVGLTLTALFGARDS
jgi:hypothetical protein